MQNLRMCKKLHKTSLLLACIHFLLSFFTDRLIFTYSLCDFTSLLMAGKSLLAIGSKIAFFFVLIIVWQALYYFVKKADRHFVKYTLIYFTLMCVLLLFTYPGIWRMDEFGILFEAQHVFPVFWQNYLTSVFYIMALMLVPVPAGVVLVQCACISLITGWLLYKVEALGIVRGRWIYALYIPFALFPVLDSNLYPMRMSLYAFLELLLLARLVFFRLEKRQLALKDLIGTILLSGIVICWRTEAIYYAVAIPVCFVVLLYSYTDKKVKTGFIIWVLIITTVLYLPQKMGDKLMNGSQYKLTGMVLPLVPLVSACAKEVTPTPAEIAAAEFKPADDETAELWALLDTIDTVVNVDLIVEGYAQGRTGISMFWSESTFQRDYTDKEFAEFEAAYRKLLLRYPCVFLKERVQTFVESVDLLENTTIIFDRTGVPNHERFEALAANKPLSKELRKNVISVLELRSFVNYDTKTPLYGIVYHVAVPLIFLIGLLCYLCIKRKWAYALLLASHLCKVPLIFLTAPSRLFMYYYPVYLTGAFVAVVLAVGGLQDKAARTEALRDKFAAKKISKKQGGQGE